jgi:hypothetical protein
MQPVKIALIACGVVVLAAVLVWRSVPREDRNFGMIGGPGYTVYWGEDGTAESHQRNQERIRRLMELPIDRSQQQPLQDPKTGELYDRR